MILNGKPKLDNEISEIMKLNIKYTYRSNFKLKNFYT